MNTKNIMIYIFIYIILYIQSICSLDLTVNTTDIPGYLIYTYDKDKIVNRKRLRAFHGRNYYCRNDNCISFENEAFWYCTYNYTYKETFYYLKCYNDFDCFYNKCIDNYCVYPEESPVTHCDTIYKYFSIFEYSYIHCGKDYQEQCNKNSECSSNSCGADYLSDIKTCSLSVKEPSDSDVGIRENKFEKIEK
ncbi:hypothetical protein PIROE2DRAFT_7985 [Piromyces sp. E2]|nr:hypothetical protein PIROE2DRAFT_7985 [Piromyces sp. E2]|eukprot:OUM65095.1 hypothetical protein PIROE2DRAFT_7985 [Piromyces sp. E2]